MGWSSCLVVDAWEILLMEMVHIYPLPTLSPFLQRRMYAAQREAARVWTVCRDLHLAARQQRARRQMSART